nr:hypothetical protein B0A51_08349 [Rachicladosporium sp. CCFEE 5018]
MIAFTEYNSARHLQRKLVALSEDIHGRRQWSLRECFYINMGGYAISQRNDSNGRATVHLWQESFIHLLQQDPSSVLPQLLSDDEIADRSKSDVFTKTVILIQVCYFCITLFTRWSKQLPVTPLEVATIAYAACSVFSYGLFLYKPQGATVVAMVAHCNTMLPDPLLLVLDTELSGHRISLLDPIENGNVSIAWTPQAHRLYSMILSLISALFGAVHLAAWTSTFPTTIERSIWRVATVISMVVFAMAFASTWLRSGNEMSDTAKLGTRTIMNSIDDIIAIELMVTYPLARLVLIVEMFRSLAYLPPEAFIATWTSNVPHFG